MLQSLEPCSLKFTSSMLKLKLIGDLCCSAKFSVSRVCTGVCTAKDSRSRLIVARR